VVDGCTTVTVDEPPQPIATVSAPIATAIGLMILRA
jgi:hypothetical protein